jgi:hypothetical protein
LRWCSAAPDVSVRSHAVWTPSSSSTTPSCTTTTNKYDWLRPTLEEIVAAYMKLYGKESLDSDDESSGTEGSEGTEEEVGEEDGEEGDEKD